MGLINIITVLICFFSYVVLRKNVTAPIFACFTPATSVFTAATGVAGDGILNSMEKNVILQLKVFTTYGKVKEHRIFIVIVISRDIVATSIRVLSMLVSMLVIVRDIPMQMPTVDGIQSLEL